jgi:hypothetical protein
MRYKSHKPGVRFLTKGLELIRYIFRMWERLKQMPTPHPAWRAARPHEYSMPLQGQHALDVAHQSRLNP